MKHTLSKMCSSLHLEYWNISVLHVFENSGLSSKLPTGHGATQQAVLWRELVIDYSDSPWTWC